MMSTTLICLCVLGFEAITGLGSNIFVIYTLALAGYKEKYFAPFSRIVIALCFSNIGYTILMSADNLVKIFRPSIFRTANAMYNCAMQYMILYRIISSSWLTGSLCIFYFIKIKHFKAGLFAWLKKKITTLVPWMILTVELIGLSMSFLSLLFCNQTSTRNSTTMTSEVTANYKPRMQFSSVISILILFPISISILSMAVSTSFLKKHSQNIKTSVEASHAGVKDYGTAVQAMSCLEFFYALIYLATLVLGLSLVPYQSWGYWMCMMVLFSLALVQSSLLITSNPKLKKAWRQMFACI